MKQLMKLVFITKMKQVYSFLIHPAEQAVSRQSQTTMYFFNILILLVFISIIFLLKI